MSFLQFASSVNPFRLKCRRCGAVLSLNPLNIRLYLIMAVLAGIGGIAAGIGGDFINLPMPITFIAVITIAFIIGIPMEILFWRSKPVVANTSMKITSASP